jgi:DNA-directed RNA polymerase specialized sigma24 family protein
LSKNKDLDFLLYNWLSEKDDRLAELKFNMYYIQAFRQLSRYIYSLGPNPVADAEDIAQHALLKFFTRVGRQRHGATEAIRNSLRALEAMGLESQQNRFLKGWHSQVSQAFRHAVEFRVQEDDEDSWKAVQKATNEQLRSVLQKGKYLLASLEISASDGDTKARKWLEHMQAICANLSLISLPTNGLLFTISKRRHIDSWRSKNPSLRMNDLTFSEVKSHDREISEDEEESENSLDPSSYNQHEAQEEVEGSISSEGNDLYLAFVRYLQGYSFLPGASESGGGSSLGPGKSKERLVLVLQALNEDPQPTEIEIAQRMGLSRNQVKYAIERIREEFSRFAPILSKEAKNRRKSPGTWA